MLNRTKRTLYDKWKGSGIDISFKQFINLKDSVQTSLHWASPKNERMLPEGEETNRENENKKEVREEGCEKENIATKRAPMLRQDSCHHTIVMINKQEDLRKKFRNYEI